MYGAILGDIIGSPYEHDRGKKIKSFPLFDRGARFTDDTVMTIAVAEALMIACGRGVIESEEMTKDLIIDSMHKWGNRYPKAGYGRRFYQWLRDREREPYNSWGNGSAMRVSPAGWLFYNIETTRLIARWTAEVTHNHPEGVKGAEAVASAIYLARNGSSKEEIKEYIENEFGYDLSRTCDEIRPKYKFDVSCQGSVPESIRAFIDGKDFEDVIRTAVSLGGDTDTIGAMAGSIAEAFYGVPEEMMIQCENRLPLDMLDILLMFHHERRAFLLKNAIKGFENNRTKEKVMEIIWYMKSTLLWVPCSAILGKEDEEQLSKILADHEDDLESLEGTTWQTLSDTRMIPDILSNGNDYFFPAFTSPEEMGEYGNNFSKVQKHIMEIIQLAKNNEQEVKGIVINAFSHPFELDKELFSIIENANTEGDK